MCVGRSLRFQVVSGFFHLFRDSSLSGKMPCSVTLDILCFLNGLFRVFGLFQVFNVFEDCSSFWGWEVLRCFGIVESRSIQCARKTVSRRSPPPPSPPQVQCPRKTPCPNAAYAQHPEAPRLQHPHSQTQCISLLTPPTKASKCAHQKKRKRPQKHCQRFPILTTWAEAGGDPDRHMNPGVDGWGLRIPQPILGAVDVDSTSFFG